MSLREEIKESLIESRNVILNGGVNCIPSELSRFRSEFPGVRKKFYYVVTGGTKSGKTQFTNFMFVITPIFYYLKHPDQIKPTIMYFPLEETKEDITLRFYSFVLNYLTKGRLTISPEDLESVDERKPLPQEVLDIMDSEEFIKISNTFEECVTFYDDRNPTGKKDLVICKILGNQIASQKTCPEVCQILNIKSYHTLNTEFRKYNGFAATKDQFIIAECNKNLEELIYLYKNTSFNKICPVCDIHGNLYKLTIIFLHYQVYAALYSNV